jgi:hypothetical protein
MTQVLTNARIFANGADLTGYANKVDLNAEVAELDATTFGSGGWEAVAAGLHSGTVNVEGLWSSTDLTHPHGLLQGSLGSDIIYTVCPSTPAVGGLAWVFKAVQSKYMVGASVGELVKFTGGGKLDTPLAPGFALHAPGTARSSSGSGTGVQIGAVSALQRMWCNLHVLSVSGTSTPTITVKLQSDDNSSFTSATDQITFTGATAVGAQASYVAGAITDDWWRITWTITGSTPSFLLIVSAGIAAR